MFNGIFTFDSQLLALPFQVDESMMSSDLVDLYDGCTVIRFR